MIYYQVGVVDFQPRMVEGNIAEYSDSYIVGEAVPIITLFKKEKTIDRFFEGPEFVYKEREYTRPEHIFWITNTAENLKPGDPVIINISTDEIYKIGTDCRGVRVNE